MPKKSGIDLHFLERVALRLFAEHSDAPLGVDFQQAEIGGALLVHRHHRNGDIGFTLAMPMNEIGIIHSV